MSWFQHKMSGIDGNGGTGGFTQDEAEQLRNALFDLSDRIRRAADNIEAPVAFKSIYHLKSRRLGSCATKAASRSFRALLLFSHITTTHSHY